MSSLDIMWLWLLGTFSSNLAILTTSSHCSTVPFLTVNLFLLRFATLTRHIFLFPLTIHVAIKVFGCCSVIGSVITNLILLVFDYVPKDVLIYKEQILLHTSTLKANHNVKTQNKFVRDVSRQKICFELTEPKFNLYTGIPTICYIISCQIEVISRDPIAIAFLPNRYHDVLIW